MLTRLMRGFILVLSPVPPTTACELQDLLITARDDTHPKNEQSVRMTGFQVLIREYPWHLQPVVEQLKRNLGITHSWLTHLRNDLEP